MAAVRRYLFGRFRLEVGSRQLWRDSETVPLTTKAFDTLLLLVRHHDRAVTKEELMAHVWPDTFVSDDSLTQSISALRRTLGDAEFIATIPRRGYRFIVPVTEVPEEAPTAAVEGVEPAAAAASIPAAPVVSPAPPVAPRRRNVTWPRAAAAVAAIAVLVVAGRTVLRLAEAPSPDPPLRFTQDAPDGTTLTSGGVLSPDGRYLAFTAQHDQTGQILIWIRPLDSERARPLAGTDGAARPFWSPDSRQLGFFSSGRLRTVGIDTESPRTVISVSATSAGGSWGTSGQILFAGLTGPLQSVPTTGGKATPATVLDTKAADVAHQWPQFLPDGRHFLYLVSSPNADRAGWYIGALDSGVATRVLDNSSTATIYSPTGHLMYIRDNVLFAQPFDVSQLGLTGTPMTIAGNVEPPARTSGATLSASARRLLAFSGRTTSEQLTWFSRAGQQIGAIETPTVLHNPTLLPDQKRLLAISFEPGLNSIWLVDLERGAPTRLVNGATMPLPSPDGTQLLFSSGRSGVQDIYLRATTGEDREQLVVKTTEPKFANDWSRDGRYVAYGALSPRTGDDLWLLPQFGDRMPIPFLQTPFNEIQSQISPDGRWMAYTSDESGRWEVYVQSFPTAGAKQIISVGGGAEPQWRRDGRELFYLAADRNLMAVDIRTGGALQVSRPRALFRAPVAGPLNIYRNHYAATADGERFIIDATSNSGLQSINVMVNWPAMLGPRP